MDQPARDITVRDNPDESRYEIVRDGEVAGFSAYRLSADRITFTHTEVDPALSGQGLGRRLVTEELDDAARRGLSVVPLCPYVREIISRSPERYLDLVPAGVRDRLGLPHGRP